MSLTYSLHLNFEQLVRGLRRQKDTQLLKQHGQIWHQSFLAGIGCLLETTMKPVIMAKKENKCKYGPIVVHQNIKI